MIDRIASPVTLPNGRMILNRLVKAAMEEGIGIGGLPDERHRRLYRQWARGGWGAIITGNVQVDPLYVATFHDRTIPDYSPSTIAAYASLRESIHSAVPSGQDPPILLVQLSHAGMQASPTYGLSRAPWSPALGPSSSRPDMGNGFYASLLGKALFPRKSRKIDTAEEWIGIVEKFVRAAEVMEKAGWDGVQIHSAHGYLLAEYLSPLSNPAPMRLPGVPEHVSIRLQLLWLILSGIHHSADQKFIKAVKINCSDFVQGGLDETRSAELIKEIVSWKLVDMLEVSGGTYTNPVFATCESPSSSASSRQSLFSQFTTSLLPHLPSPPSGPAIILTGGLHSREIISNALKRRACDLVGIGRPAALDPELPISMILNPDIPDKEAGFGGYKIPGGDLAKWLISGEWSTAPTDTSRKAEISQEKDHQNHPLKRNRRKPAPEEAFQEKKSSSGSEIALAGASISTFWHEWQMSRMGRGLDPDPRMSWLWGLIVELLIYGFLVGFWRVAKRYLRS